MINKDEIAADFNKVFDAFINAIKIFDEKDFNKIPFEDSWTAGQVVQHIILANDGFDGVLNAEVKDTDRPFDALKSQLKSIFLNFGTKMKSPEFILPALKDYDKDRHILKIENIKAGILKAINDLDLTKTCMSFELPGLGHLTRYEAIYFVIYHTERHAHQLNEIYKFLKTN